MDGLAGSITSAFSEAACGPSCVHWFVPAVDGWIADIYRHKSNPVNFAKPLHCELIFLIRCKETRSATNAGQKDVMIGPKQLSRHIKWVRQFSCHLLHPLIAQRLAKSGLQQYGVIEWPVHCHLCWDT